jgi:drug/metabolite transporter (DMT)-like permease
MTASIRTLDIPMAMAWAMPLLGEKPSSFQVIGSTIMVCACVLLSKTK